MRHKPWCKVFYKSNRIGRLYVVCDGEYPQLTPLLSEATHFPPHYQSKDFLQYEEEYIV